MGIQVNHKKMPLIPLRGLSIFPHMVLHFDVGREKSIKALEKAMLADQLIFLSTQKDIDIDLPTSKDYYTVGTVSKVKQMLKLPGDAIRVLVEGVARGEIISVDQETPFISATISMYDTVEEPKNKESEAYMRAIVTAFETYISISNKISPDVVHAISSISDPSRFADVVSSHLVLKIEQKQQILESVDVIERLELIYQLILSEIEILEVEISQAKRYNTMLLIIACDIDHFKKVNDTYGHNEGDLVLKSVVRIIKSSLRKTDILARTGGEEFIIVCHSINGEAGNKVAEKLRKKIEETPIDLKRDISISITMSFGVACYSPAMRNIEEFIKVADNRLYLAKERGRNRVVCSD